MTNHSKRVWIGLAEVRPNEVNEMFGDAVAAFVNVLALADEGTEYHRLVTRALDEHGFGVLSIENVEELSERVDRAGVSDEILKLASLVSLVHPVQFDEFHSFSAEE